MYVNSGTKRKKPAKAELNFSHFDPFPLGKQLFVSVKFATCLFPGGVAVRNYSTRAGGGSSDPAGDDVASTSVVGPSVYSSDVVSHSFILGRIDRIGRPSNRTSGPRCSGRKTTQKEINLCAESSRLADAAYVSLPLPCGDQSNPCRPGQKREAAVRQTHPPTFFRRPVHC